MKRTLLLSSCLILAFFASLNTSYSQVGIGTTNPETSSMLDVTSITKGILFPRMTLAERDAIPTPATGLMVYVTTNNQVYVNKGTPASPSWVLASTQWLQSGADTWYSAGKVGIGASPVFNLDVTGDLNFTGILRRNGIPVVTGVSAVTATTPLSSSGGSTPNITITQANSTTAGYLSPGDWTTFNNKQNALTFGNIISSDLSITGGTGAVIGSGVNMTIFKGSLTESTSSVLTITGGTNAVLGAGTTIQVNQAGASQSGYLSSADWTTFNNKISSQWLNAGPNIYYIPGNVGIGTPAPSRHLHLADNNPSTIPTFLLDQQGIGDAAMEFRRMQTSVSAGIHTLDNNAFKICAVSGLTGITYNNADLLFRIHNQTGVNKGITDINHQSRVRAHLIMSTGIIQGIWTIIVFQQVTFDEHVEYNPSNGQFIARKDGYYQVNSRIEYNPWETQMFMPNGYVSIAIYKNSSPYAEGNNLQITDQTGTVILHQNNAPNVSDVLWLQAGDIVDIRTFQTYTMMPAFVQVGHEKTYFSIHKIS